MVLKHVLTRSKTKSSVVKSVKARNVKEVKESTYWSIFWLISLFKIICSGNYCKEKAIIT